MEPLIAQLKGLPERFAALSAGARRALYAGAALLAATVVASMFLTHSEGYQYAFTKLTPEDSTAAAEALKAAGVPFRLDSGGEAIAVPAEKVHDARLLLASQGLPRAGGVGFELFDKGELGVSEFTQRVNLQRAMEGELARTIQSLAKVRSARVHVTLPRRGLFSDEERHPSAAVVVHLQPGRTLDEREVGGIRHLVASAVPDLQAEAITIVDGNGMLLDDHGGSLGVEERTEHELERRIVEVLEPAVGRSAVVARVTASMDHSEEDTRSSTYDPEKTALKNEHKRTQASQSQDGTQGNITGAAANLPTTTPAPGPPRGKSETKNDNDEERAFEVSGVVAHRVERQPRLTRLSVAVVVDGPEKEPRSEEELKRYTELAKHAVGFDEDRGDKIQLTSVPFRNAVDAGAPDAAAPTGVSALLTPVNIGAAAGVMLLGMVAGAVILLRKKSGANALTARDMLTASTSLDAPALAAAHGGATATVTATTTTAAGALAGAPLFERARQLAARDPVRAARIIDAWLREDGPPVASSSTSPSRVLEAPRG